MGRSENKQANADARAAQQESAAQGRQALAGAQAGLADYTTRLNQYMASDPYKEGGQYGQNMNTTFASDAAGGQGATEDYFRNLGTRTGSGTTAQMVAAGEEASRAARRDLALNEAKAEENRFDKENEFQRYGVQASALPADTYSRIYGTAIGGRDAALGTQAQTASQPGFWDQMAGSLISGAAGVAAGFTPHCWIAEAIYGVDDPRTHLVREWLTAEFALTPFGRTVMNLYRRFGQRVASVARKSRVLRALLRPIFDRALSNSVHWKSREWRQVHAVKPQP
jgi:hypothetical protein